MKCVFDCRLLAALKQQKQRHDSSSSGDEQQNNRSSDEEETLRPQRNYGLMVGAVIIPSNLCLNIRARGRDLFKRNLHVDEFDYITYSH